MKQAFLLLSILQVFILSSDLYAQEKESLNSALHLKIKCLYYNKNKPRTSLIWGSPSIETYPIEFQGRFENKVIYLDKQYRMQDLVSICNRAINKKENSKDLLGINRIKIIWGKKSYPFSFDYSNSRYKLGKGVNKLVIFGDSLCDAGKYQKRHKFLPNKNYWNGRFSDGPIWVEYLNKFLAYSLPIENKSEGGVETASRIDMPFVSFKDSIVGLGQSILTSTMNKKIENYIKKDRGEDKNLYLLWGGSNNYLSKLSLKSILSFLKNQYELGNNGIIYHYIDKYTNDIMEDVMFLDKLGAKHVIVAGIPDFGISPRATSAKSKTFFSYVSTIHNTILKVKIMNYRVAHFQGSAKSSLTLSYLDIAGMAQIIKDEAKLFKIKETESACFKGSFLNSKVRPCIKPDNYLFYDGVHPTSKTHCIMSLLFNNYLNRKGYISDTFKQGELSLDDMALMCSGKNFKQIY